MGTFAVSFLTHRYKSDFSGAGEAQILQGILLRKQTARTTESQEPQSSSPPACLQPWPGLGDPNLEQLLGKLNAPSAEQHPLLRNSLAALNDSLFSKETLRSYEKENTSIPTHVLIKKDDSKELLESLLQSGVNRFKIKLRIDYDFAAGVFEHLISLRDKFEFWLRFDANATTSFDEFQECWRRLGALQPCVEFVEDPCPYDWNHWTALCDNGVSIANDRPLHFQNPEEITANFPCEFLVMKPIRHDLSEWINCFKNSQKKLVLTTALDHPWGQLWAFHNYVKLREQGIPLEHGGFATATLKNTYHNPLQRKADKVYLKSVEKLFHESEQYEWQSH